MQINFNHYSRAFPYAFTEEEQLAMLTALTCPIVCKGYSTPPENWHDLCIDRAKKALVIIREAK